MLLSRSLFFFFSFSAHTASDGDSRNHSRFPAPTGGVTGHLKRSIPAWCYGWFMGGGGSRGVCDFSFSFSFFFWCMGKGTRRWDRGEGPSVVEAALHPVVSQLLFDLQALQTTTQTNKQSCQTLARTRQLDGDVDEWLGSLKKKERQGGFGPSHKATAAEGRRTDKKRERRPTPPTSQPQHTHHKSQPAYLLPTKGRRMMPSRVSATRWVDFWLACLLR